jgi:hypothetical protein
MRSQPTRKYDTLRPSAKAKESQQVKGHLLNCRILLAPQVN